MKNLNLTTSPFPYPQNQFGNSHNPGQVPWGCQPVQVISGLIFIQPLHQPKKGPGTRRDLPPFQPPFRVEAKAFAFLP